MQLDKFQGANVMRKLGSSYTKGKLVVHLSRIFFCSNDENYDGAHIPDEQKLGFKYSFVLLTRSVDRNSLKKYSNIVFINIQKHNTKSKILHYEEV